MDVDMMRYEVMKTTACIKQYVDPDNPKKEPYTREVNPPTLALKMIFTINPCPFPVLNQIINHPTINSDYEYVVNDTDTYKYDKKTRSLLMPNRPLAKRIKALEGTRPTEEQLAWANDLLRDKFQDFPFETSEDEAGVLALLVTLLFRPMVKGPVPIFVIKAPSRENGKTLLAEACTLITTGETQTSVSVNFKYDDEADKKLFAALLEGPEMVFIDNVDPRYEINSDFLAVAVTSQQIKGRVLGASAMRKVWSGMPFIMTGINPRYSADMLTRVTTINLMQTDADMSRRKFKYNDLLAEVAASRDDLIVALFTLVQCWLSADKPLGKYKIGHFMAWSYITGGIVGLQGYDNYLQSHSQFVRNSNEEGERFMQFVLSWY
jgi:hypothetical protein